MSIATAGRAEAGPARPDASVTAGPLGPIGRLGGWTAAHFRFVLSAWIVIAIGLGFFPRLKRAAHSRCRPAGWSNATSPVPAS